MSFRNKFFAILFFIFFLSGATSANITDNWEKPFLDAIRKLKINDWHTPLVSRNKFVRSSQSTLNLLKKNKDEWKVFFDQKNSVDGSSVDENSLISRIFLTKQNTLVFKTPSQPHVIVKIDQRQPTELSDNLRTYFFAYEKSKTIHKMNSFSHLYLPMEYGKKSKKTPLKYVFSEEIPLFSESEIDNIALLVILHNAMDDGDEDLEQEIRISFSQMLHYICQVDFDDINYRNVPFAKDGRLAPIDVDSGRAATGIFSFIEYFFAFRLFPRLSTIENIIPKDCFAKLMTTSWSNPYLDEKRLEMAYMLFNDTRDYLDKILEFLKTRKFRVMPKIIVHDEELEPYLDIVNIVIEKKILFSSEKKLLFGWRCDHARDLITKMAHAITKNEPTVSIAQADDIVKRILLAGKKDNIFISYGDLSIEGLANVDGVKGFICF